ncbi:protocadherin Fat 1 [Trichonephila clavipes]|nr:protocadherin Fat 1 [Trichonephila clavipes]
MTPELEPPLLTTAPHQREDVSALDRFNVHRCPTWRVFNDMLTLESKRSLLEKPFKASNEAANSHSRIKRKVPVSKEIQFYKVVNQIDPVALKLLLSNITEESLELTTPNHNCCYNGGACHVPTYTRATIDLLKDTFGDRLISRFGPVNWPPRSCDLTPLDYFLWGYVKSLVYADKPQTLDHLEDNIRRVIADIRPQMLEKVIENWTSKLDYIRASRGSHMPEIIFKM